MDPHRPRDLCDRRGLGTLARSWWAELGGVIAATLGIMSCFLFLPYFPLWTIVLIAMYAFIVWTTTTSSSRTGPRWHPGAGMVAGDL